MGLIQMQNEIDQNRAEITKLRESIDEMWRLIEEVRKQVRRAEKKSGRAPETIEEETFKKPPFPKILKDMGYKEPLEDIETDEPVVENAHIEGAEA